MHLFCDFDDFFFGAGLHIVRPMSIGALLGDRIKGLILRRSMPTPEVPG